MKTDEASPQPSSFLGRLRARLIKQTSIVEIEQHYLIGAVLERSSTVVDLGANRGRFTREIQNRYNCHVVAVEPEGSNFASLPSDDSITNIRAAIGGACGRITLQLSDDSTAHSVVGSPPPAANGDEQEVAMLDFNALVAQAPLTRIDLLKVDIEGCEWDFFDSMSDVQIGLIGQITVEFHDFVPACRERARTWPLYQRLMRLGFRCIEDPVFSSYNVLFVNKRLRLSRVSDIVFLPVIHSLLIIDWKFQRLKKRLSRSQSATPLPAQ